MLIISLIRYFGRTLGVLLNDKTVMKIFGKRSNIPVTVTEMFNLLPNIFITVSLEASESCRITTRLGCGCRNNHIWMSDN